jgi:hypothetical protein
VRVLGEVSGKLYVERALAPGAEVVSEGRALLTDGDAVAAQEAPPTPAPDAGPAEPRR